MSYCIYIEKNVKLLWQVLMVKAKLRRVNLIVNNFEHIKSLVSVDKIIIGHWSNCFVQIHTMQTGIEFKNKEYSFCNFSVIKSLR